MSYHKEDIAIVADHYDPLNVRTWPFYPIMMPLTKDGQGPATIGTDAAEITFEVWDHFCNSYGSHKYLPDAINQAMALTEELLDND